MSCYSEHKLLQCPRSFLRPSDQILIRTWEAIRACSIRAHPGDPPDAGIVESTTKANFHDIVAQWEKVRPDLLPVQPLRLGTVN